jgi:putative membrane protein
MEMTGLAPLTAGTLFGAWQFTPVTDLLVLLAAAGYLWRVHRVGSWPAGRTALFLAGLAVLAVTRQSSIDVYGHELFTMHMIEHLLLIMVVPALLVLGQPIRLFSTGEDGTAARTRRFLAGRTASVLTFPLLTLAFYAVVLVGTHLTGFMQQMLLHEWLHPVEIGLYLLSGYLYFLPLLGREPIQRQLSYPLRVFLLFLGMTVDTVVGVMLMMSAEEPFPAYAAQHRTWGPGLLTDIHTGGGIMWVVGDGLMFAITVLVIKQWMGDTERQNDTGKWLESARRSSLAGMGVDAVDPDDESDIDDDEAALAAYNRMLSRLNQQGH